MNYLAHARDVLHDPWLVAGTSLPDWLRVVDRRARVREETLGALVIADAASSAARLREGALRHHHDDARFHVDATFDALTHEAVHEIRALAPDAPRLRASALGHIVVEMLLDSVVEERRPGATERYYEAVAQLDGEELARIAREWTGRELGALPTLLERFRRARFLFSYADDEGVVDALAGVAWRTGMAPPPPGTERVVAALRPRVRAAAGAWL